MLPWVWEPAPSEAMEIFRSRSGRKDHALLYWKMGHPKHHSNEDAGQCGVIINTQYNRDAQCHSHSNFTRSGLPLEIQKRLADEIWGSTDAVDAVAAFTPMNRVQSENGEMGPSEEGAT